MRRRLITSAALMAVTLTACSTVGDYLAEEYEKAKKRDKPEVMLAKVVANTQSNQAYATNLVSMYGSYGGVLDNGCHAVSIHVAQFKRTNHYVVCGNDVRIVSDLTPSAPSGPGYDAVSDTVARAAWASGAPRLSEFDGYRIEAVPIGPPDSQACRQIEERLTHGQALVRVRTRKVCP